MFFHSRSRSREFLGMIASDSHSRIVGMDFFHSLPVPELWEWIFFIPFPFPNFGNKFFHSLPIPEFWECFSFIPFPFPNCGNGFYQFPSRSRIDKSHSRSPLTLVRGLIGGKTRRIHYISCTVLWFITWPLEVFLESNIFLTLPKKGGGINAVDYISPVLNVQKITRSFSCFNRSSVGSHEAFGQ